MMAELNIQRIEPRVAPDLTSDANWLLTTMDGDHIVDSVRYSDFDVAEYGIDKVRDWIADDTERYAAWQRDEWGFLDMRLVAVVAVQAAGQQVGTLEIDGPALGGIESDAGDDYMTEVVGDLAAEFHAELEAVGFTTLDATLVGPIVTE